MAENYILAGEGSLFVQPYGPNTKPEYLGCHTLGDLAEPFGDLTLVWKKNPAGPNMFVQDGAFQGEPGPLTTSVEVTARKTRDFMEKLQCPFPFYIMHNSCGRGDNINNWDRLFVLEETYRTNRGDTNLAINDPASQEKSMMTFDLSAVRALRLYELSCVRVTTSETEGLNDIFSCIGLQCAGDCGDAYYPGDVLFAVGDTLAGSPANPSDVLFIVAPISSPSVTITTDPGKPFGAAEAIAAVRCVEISNGVTRIIVARGTTDAGNPAEIAYKTYGNVAWTQVNVGSVNAQYVQGAHGLVVIDQYSIWLVTTGGYVYKSENGGQSWTVKSSGLTSQNLTAIDFFGTKYGFAVGANNAIIKTVDAGATWALVTGPTGQAAVTINSVKVLSKNRVWLFYADGKIYYSHDGGTTWTRRQGWSYDGQGSVVMSEWYDVYFGVFVQNVSSVGHVFVTVDGGYDWKEVSVPGTIGNLTSVVVISPTLMWAVGDASGGTAVILKISAE